MGFSRRVPVFALGAALGLSAPVFGAPTAGQAAKTYTTAKVVRVVDGDTIKVDYGRGGRWDGNWDASIRLIGIDTPEHDRCGFTAAKRALRQLVRHKVVTLKSDSGRIGYQNRPERRVIVPVAGRPVDATTWLLERGLGVWMPRKGELTNTLRHHMAADTAARNGVGWFDEDRCGSGPAPNGALSMQVEYLPDYATRLSLAQRRNQEFIRIRNTWTEPVDLDGWTLRVGNNRSVRVPPGGPIPPGETLTVHVGSGTTTVLDRYLGSNEWMLVDADLDGRRHVGGGSYLVDPHGDIRAHATWPCAVECVDPYGGALVLSRVVVDPPGAEYLALNSEEIVITNRGSVPVRTGDVVLEVAPWSYEFPPAHTLDPGESVTVRGGAGQDERLSRYLDAQNPPLHNNGGRVVLRTYNSVVVDCFAWGTGRCPGGS